MEDLTGKEIGQFRIVGPLGEGGMAAVYQAFQPGTERYVALKILPSHYSDDPTFRERFQLEAKTIAKFQHPHILPVFDYGEEDGYAYLAMPLVKGGVLTDLIRKGPLAMGQVRAITSQIADALDYAHGYGVIHRDVKPGNILIGERGNALLTDFGISKIVGESVNITGTGQVIGTPAYMSPEQIRGEPLDGRTDIYSLGIVLYEMVTGRTPFRAETPPALFVKHLLDPLPPPSSLKADIPQPVEKVILKSLAKDPDERYNSAAEMAEAIQRAVDFDPSATSAAAAAAVPDIPLSAEEVRLQAPSSAADSDGAETESVPVNSNRRRTAIGIVIVVAALLAALFIAFVVWQPIQAPAADEPIDVAALVAQSAAQGELISHWSFDEGAGTVAADSSPSGYENDAAVSDDPSWVQGLFGEAVHLDASQRQRIRALNNGDSLSIASGGITISAWIKPDLLDGEQAIVAKDNKLYSSRGNYFFGLSDGRLQFGFQPKPSGADVWIETAFSEVEEGEWAFVAVTFNYENGEDPHFYVNGVEVKIQDWQGSGEQASAPFVYEDVLNIGSSDNHDNFFSGTIDELKIYDRVLIQDEISNLEE